MNSLEKYTDLGGVVGHHAASLKAAALEQWLERHRDHGHCELRIDHRLGERRETIRCAAGHSAAVLVDIEGTSWTVRLDEDPTTGEVMPP